MKHACALAMALLPLAVWAAEPAGNAPLPNLLVILTDDVGWGDSQCYNAECKFPTPNIDRLAREGMRFTNAHTPAALCSPTRYSMLTGNYPWRGRNPSGTWGFNDPSQIMPGQQTLAQLLKPAGYRSAMFGKAGFGGSFNSGLKSGANKDVDLAELAPVQMGFDYSYLIPRGHQSSPYGFYENGVAVGKMRWQGKNQLGAEGWDPSQIGERLVLQAAAFLDDHLARNRKDGKNQPFFMHFCTDGAHSPYNPPAKLLGTPLKGATKMTAHTDMVYETDVVTGKLLELLEQRGLLANTLVVYTSDNGGMPFERKHGHDAVGGLRGRKASIFEAGHRVPFIVKWGDGTPQGSKIPPGIVRDQMVCTHDIVATALDAAALPVPEDQCLDAVSLLPVLLGRQDDARPVRQTLLVQSSSGRDAFDDLGFPNHLTLKPSEEDKAARDESPALVEGRSSDNMSHALFSGSWKLVMDIENDRPAALYDLGTDLEEQRNRMGEPEQADRVKAMFSAYAAMRASKRSTPAGRQ